MPNVKSSGGLRKAKKSLSNKEVDDKKVENVNVLDDKNIIIDILTIKWFFAKIYTS